jgi:2-dehydropantoate 2-reductase
MRIAIVGAGAIGAVLGAKLAASGHEVVLIARGAHLAALQADGLQLDDRVGACSGRYRLRASAEPADFGVQQVVFICLKAHAIAAMLPRLAPLVAADTMVVPAINGLPWWYFHRAGGEFDGIALKSLDPDASMFGALDCSHIVGCVVHLAAEVRAPGVVQHTNGRRLILGEPAGGTSERLDRICGALAGAGFDIVHSTDIRVDVWTKLIGNLSFNPIAALTGYLMDEIVADDDVLAVIRTMMIEAMRVAERCGVRIEMTPDERIGLARQLGAAKISMLQDLEQRRPLELAAIVGAVIELAERARVDVPTIRHVHALAQARARALRIA